MSTINPKPINIDHKDYEKLKLMHFRQMLDSHFGNVASDMITSAEVQNFVFDEVSFENLKEWVPPEVEEFVGLYGPDYLIIVDPVTATFLPDNYPVHVTHDVRSRGYLVIAKRVDLNNSALTGFTFHRMVKIKQPKPPRFSVADLIN